MRKDNEQMLKKVMTDFNKSQIESRLNVLEGQVASALVMALKK